MTISEKIKMKCNTTLVEKLQSYQHNHQAKCTNKIILQVKKRYCFLVQVK